MAIYAKVENNIVQNVIIADLDFISTLEDSDSWILSSNKIGKHWNYDSDDKVFYPPQPYPSWTLSSNHTWQPPVAKPEGQTEWDEENKKWVTE